MSVKTLVKLDDKTWIKVKLEKKVIEEKKYNEFIVELAKKRGLIGKIRLNIMCLIRNFRTAQERKLEQKLYREVKLHEKKTEWARKRALMSMFISIFLGVVFMYLQSLEYRWTRVTIRDGTYGGGFFLLTGFHGLHVIVGIVFLCVCWIRIYKNHFIYGHSHLGLDCAIAYWHFVDAVWIGLYVVVYLWPYFLGWTN